MLSERALERRLKRHLMKERHDFFVPCVPGFEDVLEDEVRALPGAEDLARTRGGMTFSGPLDLTYHANLRLATGQRVLLRVGTYLAQTFPMLYDHLRRIHWELYLGFQDAYSVRVATSASRLDMSARIEGTLADAIRARTEDLGLDPRPHPDASIGIHLRLHRDRCTVSIDTSGAHLHRRGVRTHVGEAPLRETLAAACLLAADASGAQVVVDPFCGSGAIALEAARILAGAPPGAARTFAFEVMPWFQPSKWERFRAEAVANAEPVENGRVIASDLDRAALDALHANASRLPAGIPVEVQEADALARTFPPLAAGVRGLVATNLPYGKRILSPRRAAELAERFSDALRAGAGGYEVAVVTQHAEPFMLAPFRVLRRTDFRNGGLRVSFVHASLPAKTTTP